MKSKHTSKNNGMNILLWTLQIVLALYNLAGAVYMMQNHENVASTWALGLPAAFWILLGIIQILFSIGIVTPPKVKNWRKLVHTSAVGLAIISLLGDVLYLTYSRFPGLLWGVIPAALAAFVAYKRWQK